MNLTDRATLAVYFAYAIQATGLAISWQFSTFWLKNDIGEESFLIIALAVGIPAFVTLLSANFWGSVSDRIGRRKPFMILGFAGYASTFFFYSFVTSSWQYLFVAILGAFFSGAALPVGQAYLTHKSDKKGERLGFFLMAQSAGWFFGALSSGLLYDPIGMLTLFRIAAILCIGATAVSAFGVRDVFVEIESEEDRSTFREVFQKPGMPILTTAVSLSSIGMNAIAFVMAIMVVNELGGLEAHVGYSNSVATLIAVAVTGYIGRVIDRRGPIRILILAYISYIVFAIGFGLVTDPIAAVIMWALPIYPLSSTAAFSFASMVTSEEERGRAMGLVNGAQNIGQGVGPIIGGLFADGLFTRVQPLSWINMFFNIGALLLAIILLRKGLGMIKPGEAIDELKEQVIE
ncbi:MAG: MFS transporter [Candidatus Thorarchaeota archaeon]|jgi:MFS family permease